MFYLMFGILFFVLQSLLITSLRINIYPEFFFLPWLVSKGFLPYKDFFTHHGFLLDYLLAFLSLDKSLLLVELFYFVIQSLNLILLLLILKKITSKIGFVMCGLLYLLLNFYLSENNLWYEIVITTFFLVIYYLLKLKDFKNKIPRTKPSVFSPSYLPSGKVGLNKFVFFACRQARRLGVFAYIEKNPLILGTLAALVSFIKPNAAIILFPILYTTKKVRIFFYFLMYWVVVGMFFFLNHGLFEFIDELFLFNIYYASYIKNLNFFLIERDFYTLALLISGLLFIFILLNKKISFNMPLLLFIICSFTFIFPVYSKMSLVPVAPFFVIYLGYGLKKIKIFYKFLLIGILFYFLLFMGRKVKHQYWLNYKKLPYIEQSKKMIVALKNEGKFKDNIYVFGNKVEVYYFLNKLPPTHFPMNFPWIINYFHSERQIISEIKMKKIGYIIIPKPIIKEYLPLYSLKQFINDNYSVVKNTNEFQLFRVRP